ncbi:MAG: hypothetical protein HQL09_08475 [Nitrospirae bacterium]|nr:hypothetical protein [Nitrospirota bacterium]
MGTVTHRTQIYLNSEQHAFLRLLSEREQISMAEAVRQLIDEKLPKEKDYDKNPLFSIGKKAVSMGRKDGSAAHDKYIYRGKGK